tara:strand:- start:160 stop:651 length:492 start_codon:yes stop_codon:yes gene_type:complete
MNINEQYGLPSNTGRNFGEKFIKDFIKPGKFAELWTALEKSFPDLTPKLKATFEKSNDLFKFIKPEQGDESYRLSTLPEAVVQELEDYLDTVIAATEEASNLDSPPTLELAEKIIEWFDGIFTDMLDLFTSNTAGDAPLKPYQQTNIGFALKEILQIRAGIKK